MNRWMLSGAAAALLLAFVAPWPSAEADGKKPPAPYVLRFEKVDSVKASSLRESLEKVSGVASVEVNAQGKWVKVTAQKDSLMPRRHLLAAAEKLDLNVTSYEVPQWAQQVVYDVGTTGGG